MQTGYVQFGQTTAKQRMLPSFVMVGASRSGTTSLFRALLAHPQVHRPTVNKGVRYFDLNYHRPESWYRAHFPLAGLAQRRSRNYGPPVTFEASGYYIFHPFAIQRLASTLPEARIVAILRDPVERAYSAWKHESGRGFEWEPFERALELEDERLAGELDRMRYDSTYRSFSYRHHSYRRRGEYLEQLQRVFEHFPREQVHVMQSEKFFKCPDREYANLIRFLGLREFDPGSFQHLNARPSAPMSSNVRRHLEDHYRPLDEQLTRLLGERLEWQVPES